MKIEFSEKQKEVDEKIILVTIMGVLESIKIGGISVEEAEKFVFSPYIVKKLNEKGCNKKIVKIVEKGCELEDVESIIPERFHQVIDEMKQETQKVLQNYDNFNHGFWVVENEQTLAASYVDGKTVL